MRHSAHADRLVRLPETLYVSGHSKTSLYDSIKNGDFPKPKKIGKRAVAWSLAEIEAWMASRKAAA